MSSIKAIMCPSCGHKINAATGLIEDSLPKKGDLSLCFYCGEILTFTEDLSQEILSEEKFGKLPAKIQTKLKRIQTSIRSELR